jgi:hypothetical protein
MVFEGQMMDAGKFRKQLLSLSQNELCADCLISVLNELDDAPKIGILGEWKGEQITEKDMILNILHRIPLKVYWQDDKCIEFENGYGNEDILIDFDENGNVTNIYC